MRVLVACEFSGRVREAFAALGHDAWSCDLLPTEWPGKHIQQDVLSVLDQGWDLMIAHPPCTYLCTSGIHWNGRIEGRAEKTQQAILFVKQLLAAPINKIALENPVGVLTSQVRKPDQVIQPYQFGHREAKKTCLWLKNLLPLFPTDTLIPNRFNAAGQPLWENQNASGQNTTEGILSREQRWVARSRTYTGIAKAMAEQWGRN